jgi:protein-L-isoaspartate O-methyltransferase
MAVVVCGDNRHPREERLLNPLPQHTRPDVPPPLIEQLAVRGRLIVPVMEGTRQRLTLLEKNVDGVRRKSLADVLYVSLQGRFGVRSD